MKKIVMVTLVLCLMLAIPVAVYAEGEAYIPDNNMEAALKYLCSVEDADDLYPADLAALTGTVDLSNLEITNITGIEYLTGATVIDLSHNDIETFSRDFNLLTNLEELNLSFNEQAYTFPTVITKIPNLVTLKMAANKFTRLSDALTDMTTLKNLDISGNRLENVPDVLTKMTFENLNMDYNFFDLADGRSDRQVIDAITVTGEYLVSRQLNKLPAITYVTNGGNIKVKWYGLDDIPFYDGTYGRVSGYTILVNGSFMKNVNADTRSYEFPADAGVAYNISVSPSYAIDGYGDFDIRQYTVLSGCMLGSSGADLPETADPTVYDNLFPTPEPTPTPTPTPEATPTPEPTPEPMVETQPSASPEPQVAGFWTNMMFSLILLIIIVLLIVVIAILLIVILKNKNIRGKDEIYEETDDTKGKTRSNKK